MSVFSEVFGDDCDALVYENSKGERMEYIRVVRCKDCRWHEREQPGMVYCPNTVGNWVEDDWYCKGGERRDDDTD